MVSFKLCGVILAAGKGERLSPLSLTLPKPLLPVLNRPVIEYQIEEMKALGIREVFVLVQHLKEQIMGFLGDGHRFGVSITYVEQKQTLGIAHAVGQLEGHVNRPFLLTLGDIFFRSTDLPAMVAALSEKKAAGVLAVREEEDRELVKRNFAVSVGEGNRVHRVIEKPRYLETNLKGCGIYLFTPAVFDAIRMTPRTAMRDEYEITNSIQILIDQGFPVYAARVIQWDMNLTYVRDLLRCNLQMLGSSGRKCLMGDGCHLPAGAQVVNSVLGDRVVVEHPILIRDSLVLADSRLAVTTDLVGAVVGPQGILVEGSQGP